MQLTFAISSKNRKDFIRHWSSKYEYSNGDLYLKNIGKPLTSLRIEKLFLWKNGSTLSKKKQISVKTNYPAKPKGSLKERYLNPSEPGGPIWNIFFLHCNAPNSWPIFDQHTYRAMQFIKTGKFAELADSKGRIYDIYTSEYIPFVKSLGMPMRDIDQALFAFGKFLKIAKRYA
jgi:hypothetical protein